MSSSGFRFTIGLVTASLLVACGDDKQASPNSGGSSTTGGSATTAGKSGSGGHTTSNGSAGKGGTSNPQGGSGGSSTNEEDCRALSDCCATVSDSTLRAAACGTGAQVDCSLALTVLLAQGECREDPGSQLPEVTLDGAWQAAQEVAVITWQGQSITMTTPVVEPCGEGDALAAWYQDAGDIGQVQAARYSAASHSWQVSSRIDQNSGLQPGNPYLAASSSCEALVVWKERLPVLGAVSDEYTLVGSTYGAGATFSAPFTIQPTSNVEPMEIQLGLTDDGTGLLGFRGNTVVRQRSPQGAGFDAATPLSNLGIDTWGSASLDDGRLLLAYVERDPDTQTTSARFQIYTDAWSEPAELLPSGTLASSFRVIGAGDRFYVQYGAQPGVGLVSVMTDGTVSAPESITGAPDGAQLVANGEHQLLTFSKDQKLFAMQRTGTGAWSSAEQISADIHQALGYAAAIDAEGRAMVVYGDSKYAAFANRRITDGTWLGVHAINAYGTQPALTVNRDGSFFASYYASHGGLANPQVSAYVQVFEPSTK